VTDQPTGHIIEIEFCVPCDFQAQAIDLAREILDQWAQELATLTLTPSRGGRFEVSLDGEVIFSKAQLDRHASPGEINSILESRLGPPPGFGA
jgi:selenoprotein W-related protein